MLNVFEFWIAMPLLAVAAACDVSSRRIPNVISASIALSGVAATWSLNGLAAAVQATGAAILVGALLLFAWIPRAIGGGDLKLAVACGAWLGFSRLFPFALVSACVGGVLAAVCVVASSVPTRREMMSNIRLSLSRAIPVVSIKQGNGRVSVPYGAAFAVATVWILVG